MAGFMWAKIVWTAAYNPQKIQKSYICTKGEMRSRKPRKKKVFCAADRVFSLFLAGETYFMWPNQFFFACNFFKGPSKAGSGPK